MTDSMEEEHKGLATEEGQLGNDEVETSNTRGFVDFVPQVLDRKRERKVANFKELEDQVFQSISQLRKQKQKQKQKETKSADKTKQVPTKGTDGSKKKPPKKSLSGPVETKKVKTAEQLLLEEEDERFIKEARDALKASTPMQAKQQWNQHYEQAPPMDQAGHTFPTELDPESGPVEVDPMPLDEAMKYSVKDARGLLLNWNLEEAKFIGNMCKVYYDGDDVWFYGRIINYDPSTKLHRVWYSVDNAHEWINLAEDIVIVSCQYVMVAQKGKSVSTAWPAQRYVASPKALSVLSSMETYKPSRVYVEYYSDRGKPPYAFTTEDMISDFNENTVPKRPSAKMIALLAQVEDDKKMRANIIKDLITLTQNALFIKSCNKYSWVGLRVKVLLDPELGNTTEITEITISEPDHGQAEPTEQRRYFVRPSKVSSSDAILPPKEIIPVAHTGLVAQYCVGSGEHLIVFDSPDLRPRWITMTRGLVEVLLGPLDDCQFLTMGVDPSCDTDNHYESTEQTNLAECSLCGSTNHKDNMMHCDTCSIDVHTFCMPVTKLKSALRIVQAAVPKVKTTGNSHSIGPLSAIEDDKTNWQCWMCQSCESCNRSFWASPIRLIDLHRVDEDLPEHTMRFLCGLCLHRYKRTKEYCPICCRLYSSEEEVTEAAPSLPEGNIMQNGDFDSKSLDVSTGMMDVSGESLALLPSSEDENTDQSKICAAKEEPTTVDGVDNDRMVQCNECARWVHALCEGIDQAQYEAMTNGTHPVWGYEYLCPICRVKISVNAVRHLKSFDHTELFALPVTEEVAANYFDIVHNPMDLQTMNFKASRGQYKSLQVLRQDFELMCMNAIEFNKMGDEYWKESSSYFFRGKQYFEELTRCTTISAYGVELMHNVSQYNETVLKKEAVLNKEKKKISQQENMYSREHTTSRSKRGKDQVSGRRGSDDVSSPHLGLAPSDALSENLSPEAKKTEEGSLFFDVTVRAGLSVPQEPTNYLPSTAHIVAAEQAIYTCTIDQCLACGSSGCPGNMLFCVDCGECAHSFCVDIPFAGMSSSTQLVWRCLNCKVCEVPTCSVTNDSPEWTRMIICDLCDRGYHMCCLSQHIEELREEAWFCPDCNLDNFCQSCCPDYMLSESDVIKRTVSGAVNDLVLCVDIRLNKRTELNEITCYNDDCARCAVLTRYRLKTVTDLLALPPTSNIMKTLTEASFNLNAQGKTSSRKKEKDITSDQDHLKTIEAGQSISNQEGPNAIKFVTDLTNYREQTTSRKKGKDTTSDQDDFKTIEVGQSISDQEDLNAKKSVTDLTNYRYTELVAMVFADLNHPADGLSHVTIRDEILKRFPVLASATSRRTLSHGIYVTLKSHYIFDKESNMWVPDQELIRKSPKQKSPKGDFQSSSSSSIEDPKDKEKDCFQQLSVERSLQLPNDSTFVSPQKYVVTPEMDITENNIVENVKAAIRNEEIALNPLVHVEIARENVQENMQQVAKINNAMITSKFVNSVKSVQKNGVALEQQRRLHTALEFISRVKVAFKSEPAKYNLFVETVRACKAQRFDAITILNKLKVILAGKRDLILGLNCVLPEGMTVVETSPGEFSAVVQNSPYRSSAANQNSPYRSSAAKHSLVSTKCVVCLRNCLGGVEAYMKCSGCRSLIHTSCCNESTVVHPVIESKYFLNFLCPSCTTAITASSEISSHLGTVKSSFSVLNQVSIVQRLRLNILNQSKRKKYRVSNNEIAQKHNYLEASIIIRWAIFRFIIMRSMSKRSTMSLKEEISCSTAKANRFECKMRLLLSKLDRTQSLSTVQLFSSLQGQIFSDLVPESMMNIPALVLASMAASYVYVTTNNLSQNDIISEFFTLLKIFRENSDFNDLLKDADVGKLYEDFSSGRDIVAILEPIESMLSSWIQRFLFTPVATKEPVLPSVLFLHQPKEFQNHYKWSNAFSPDITLLHRSSHEKFYLSGSDGKSHGIKRTVDLRDILEYGGVGKSVLVEEEAIKSSVNIKPDKHQASTKKLRIESDKQVNMIKTKVVVDMKKKEFARQTFERKLMSVEDGISRKARIDELKMAKKAVKKLERRESREPKVPKLPKEIKETKEPKDVKDAKEPKEPKEPPYYVAIFTERSGSGHYGCHASLHDVTRRKGGSSLSGVRPLRGWNDDEFSVDANDGSNKNASWFDPRVCAFCKLGEDDEVDCVNMMLDPTTKEESTNALEKGGTAPVADNFFVASNSNTDLSACLIEEPVIPKVNSSEILISEDGRPSIEDTGNMGEDVEHSSQLKNAIHYYSLDLKLVSFHSDDEVKAKWDLLPGSEKSSYEAIAIAEAQKNSFSALAGASRKRDRGKSTRWNDFDYDENAAVDKKKLRTSLTSTSVQKTDSRKVVKEEYDKKNMVNVENIYGRLIPMADGNFGHVNCIRWCPNVIERGGYLYNAGSVKNFVHQMRSCTVCGQRMACLACEHPACRKFFHFGCAISVGCKFSEAKLSTENGIGPHDIYTFMHCPAHVDSRTAKPFQLNHLWKPVNPTRLFNIFDDSEEVLDENAADSIVLNQQVAVSRRLVSSSFGLSFTNKSSQRAVRSGGICAAGIGFKGTQKLLNSLYKGQVDQASSEMDDSLLASFSCALRSGTITVLDLGVPLVGPGTHLFHTETLIFPYGYRCSRIFWSGKIPMSRTVYFFDIITLDDFESEGISKYELEDLDLAEFIRADRSSNADLISSDSIVSAERPVFRVIAMDDPGRPIFTRDLDKMIAILLLRIDKSFDRNLDESQKIFYVSRRQRRYAMESYGLTPSIFFGLGLPWIRRAIEMLPESVASMITPPPHVQYNPCYVSPSKEDIRRIQQFESILLRSKRVSAKGCARADGWEREVKDGGSKVTRILAKTVGGEEDETDTATAAKAQNESEEEHQINDDLYMEELIESQRLVESTRQKYRDMAVAYLKDEHNLQVRRSKIHGWGLFARTSFSKNDLIVEYIGQKIRQVVADKREAVYEQEGVGSCYLFRLDKDEIVDATRTGGMARFMNHCCEPNAYAGIVTIPSNVNPSVCQEASTSAVPTDPHVGKHIVIFAGRDIQEGEEITYDYKFPIEDTKLRCYCGAPKCQGSMN